MDYWEYKRLLKHVSTNILSWELRKKNLQLGKHLLLLSFEQKQFWVGMCSRRKSWHLFPSYWSQLSFWKLRLSRDKGGGMPSLSNVSWNSEFANYKNFYSPSPKRWVPNWELELDGVFCQANKTRVLHFLCLSQMQLCILLAYLA